MPGEFCEHGKIWTICNKCGKDVIKKAKQEQKAKPPEADEAPKKVDREVKPPPKEPKPTKYESGGA